MSDLFEEAVSVEDFALPGDDARLGRAAAAEPAPEAAVEPGPEAAVDEPQADESAVEAETTETQPGEPETDHAARVDQLERRIADKDEFIGRLSNEVGESRRLIEELAAREPAQAAVQITSDMIDTNPAYAAQLAYEQENGVAFAAAFDAWREEDPFQAAAWATSKRSEELIAERDVRHEQRLTELEQRVAPAAAATQQNEFVNRAQVVITEFPEIPKLLEDGTIGTIADEYPSIGESLAGSDPVKKAAALRQAAEIARGRLGDTLKASRQEVARQTAEAAQTVRDESFVASTTTTTSGTKPSRAEEIGAEWDAMEAPYNDGWNVS